MSDLASKLSLSAVPPAKLKPDVKSRARGMPGTKESSKRPVLRRGEGVKPKGSLVNLVPR